MRIGLAIVALLSLAGALLAAKKLGLRARLARLVGSLEIATAAPPAPTRWPREIRVAHWIYQGGLREGWQDWGWSARKPDASGALRTQLADWGGVRLVHAALSEDFGGLTLRYRAPKAWGRFLQVQLADQQGSAFPWIALDAEHEKRERDGWVKVFVPMTQLNPREAQFEHVVLMATKALPADFIELDAIGLTAPDPANARPIGTHAVTLAVQCDARATPISPLIYGIGMAQEQKEDDQWWVGATIRRWGGNPTTRYNWKLGNAWNTASDWFFENVDYVGDPQFSYRTFIARSIAHQLQTALTVPMIGWVAKDTRSSSFPRARYGVQDAFDPWRPEAGNGMRDGKPLTPGSPKTTSVAAPPAFIGAWVEAIRTEDRERGRRGVRQYILDNEPNLWSITHRDVHPEALGYDELLERTIAYGSAIRAADPEATIAGPAEWGWTNYFYSAKDLEHGTLLPVDRAKHGGVALIPWYLRKLAEHEKKTGVKILDVLDLHFYPEKVYSAAKDRETAALRVRSTRSLWDPSYREESWIAEPVMLLPRMRAWIDESYPGLGISIGEWNFGGEEHMSGAVAVAEALGRFGTHGVTSAFYWTYPKAASPAAWAFRAYRNFDGRGGRFEAWSVPTRMSGDVSLFASRDADGKRWVLIAINRRADSQASTRIELGPCVAPRESRSYVYDGAPTGFRATRAVRSEGALSLTLPPYAIGVIELH